LVGDHIHGRHIGHRQPLYEAARIDGASRMQTIGHITLPSIMPVIVIVLILRCGSILDAGFEQIFIMYNTSVRSTVDIIDTWVYRTGLENFNISLSSAVGLFKSGISLILVVSVNHSRSHWGSRCGKMEWRPAVQFARDGPVDPCGNGLPVPDAVRGFCVAHSPTANTCGREASCSSPVNHLLGVCGILRSLTLWSASGRPYT
jgi:hypothetical protein